MKRNSQKQINRAYHSRIKGMLKGQVEKEIFDALAAGKNNYLRYDRLQSSSFDSSWIEMIEGVIFDLGEIIANPKMNTKVEGNIVPVELARKTGAESVQHLSSHTQYIKEVDEYGNVIPSKIMTMVNEDDLHTYENRFIATLVRRLVLFIEKRYEVVSEFAELRNQEVLMFKNKSIVNGAEVEIETKVRIAYKSDDKEALKSSAYIERIKQIRNYILYFYNSSFMRQLKTERDVRNPILQTNIIRKNPKYHHCYEVYRFIETYDRLGVNYKIDENYSLFNEEEINELNHTLFANFVTLRGKDISKNHKEIKHVYKPRIETHLDDEQFIYGPLMKGPFSFVRADDRYHEYLENKINKDLPLHPTKHEKLYYFYDYEEKKEIREEQKQREDLFKRRNKELRDFEKQVNKILEERELARKNWEKMEQDLIKQEEDARLTAMRNEIIMASLSDHEEATTDFLAKQEERRLNDLKARIANTEVIPMTHPYTAPVTYDEAVAEIWPNTVDAPIYRVPREDENDEPVTIAPKEQESDKAPVVVPMSHPHQDPVTYEQAVEQIWPQTKGVSVLPIKQEEKKQPATKKAAKAKKEAIVIAPVVEEEKVEAPVEEAQAQPVVTPMTHPYSEPVTYDEAVEQIWPQVKNAPALRVAPKEEQATEAKEGQPVKKVRKPVAPEYREPVSNKQPESKPVNYEQAINEIWPNIKDNKARRAAPKKEVEPSPLPAVVPMSHPHTDPVTYDEAVEEIWPQVKNAPALRVAPVEEVKEEAPKKAAPKAKKAAKISKPAPAPVAVEPAPYNHPYSEPVTYDQAVEQIWPNVKNAPALRIEPKEEVPVKEENKVQPKKAAPKAAKKKEARRAPTPAVDPAPYNHPYSEPVSYEEAVNQIWPNIKNAPALRVAPVEENEPVAAPAKKAAPVKEKNKAPKAKAAPIKEVPAEAKNEAPNKKKEPRIDKVPEPIVRPVLKNVPPMTKGVSNKKPANKQASKAPVKRAPVKPVAIQEAPREKIPGRFIVKTHQGYYVSKNKFSIYKDNAKIFDDYNLAKDIKKELGGKIVKL